MSLKFNLKKGFNINLDGSAINELGSDFKTNSYAVKPTDFINITRPKLLVEIGDDVKAGTPILYDKLQEKNLVKVDNKDRKPKCDSNDIKKTYIGSGSNTSGRVNFITGKGKRKKYLGVVVK